MSLITDNVAELRADILAKQVHSLNEENQGLLDFVKLTVSGRIIVFDVVLNSMSGADWYYFLIDKGFSVSESEAVFLRNAGGFGLSPGKISRHIIVPGTLVEEPKRTTWDLVNDYRSLGHASPHPEISCHIRYLISDAAMKAIGVRQLLTMHNTPLVSPKCIKAAFLSSSVEGDGNLLTAVHTTIRPDTHNKDDAFIFEARPGFPNV